MNIGRTEIRFELDPTEIRVLDGVCQAEGRGRTEVMRQILREWSERELHKAIVVCRVAGCHPAQPEPDRR